MCSLFIMAQACLPFLKSNKGAIVNIGSKVSFTGQGEHLPMPACGGRNALTRNGVGLFTVRVNGIIICESYSPLYEKWINTLTQSGN